MHELQKVRAMKMFFHCIYLLQQSEQEKQGARNRCLHLLTRHYIKCALNFRNSSNMQYSMPLRHRQILSHLSQIVQPNQTEPTRVSKIGKNYNYRFVFFFNHFCLFQVILEKIVGSFHVPTTLSTSLNSSTALHLYPEPVRCC